MTPGLLAAGYALVAATLAGAYLLRGRRLWIRLVFETCCLGLLSALLVHWQASPTSLGKAFPAGGAAISIRLTAGCWWLVAARILTSIISAVLGHDERSREARLVSDLLGAGVYLMAALCVIDFVLQLPIKGVLATSGIVAVVIGLALQNTLADVFSGIAVGVEAPFSVGDRISLGGTIEGVVVQINWRSTRVRTDGGDVAIIPNSRVARSEIVNRSVPTERRTSQVSVQCAASVPPREVLEILDHAILLTPTLMATPPASSSITRLGASRNTYAVDFSVIDSAALGTARNQLFLSMRRLLDHAGLLQAPGATGARRTLDPADVLRGTALFDALDDGQIAALAARLERRRIGPGAHLFKQGEEDPTLYVMAGGVLEISTDGVDHSPAILGRIGAGEFIGEVCLLTGAPHPATAIAMTSCEVLCLGKATLAPLLRDHPELVPGFQRAVAAALDQIHRGAAGEASRRAAGGGPILDRIYSFFHHAG